MSAFPDYTTNETRPVTFQCSSTGIPVPSITWYRNGTALINNTRISISTSSTVLLEFDLYQVTQTLTITNTADTDSGNYSCAGNNTAGTDSDEFELVVQFAPRPTVSPQALTVSEGMATTFVCIVRALPLADVMWFFNSSDGTLRQLIPDNFTSIVSTVTSDTVVNSTIVISPVTRLREGQYICSATNPLATITDTASLNVQYIPDIYDSASNVIIVQPNNVTVFCLAIANPRPDIQWFKMNESLTPLVNSTKYSIISMPTGDRNRSSALSISDTNPSDTAQYICRASNPEGERNTSIIVTVHVIPEISSSNQTYVTNEMTSIVFQCSVAGIPAPNITWYRGGMLLAHSRVSVGSPSQQLLSSGLYQVTQTLTITNTADSDSGNYSCMGNNTAGANTALFELVVQIGPVFFIPPQPEITVQPGTTEFSCSANGRPRPSLSWLRNVTGVNEEIVTGTKFSIDETMSGDRAVRSDLTINPTQALDAGQYLCVADNVVRSVTSSATLTVYVSPTILFPAIDQQFIVNQTDSLIITCNASAIPTPSITWYRNGSMLDSSVSRITLGDTSTLDSFTTTDGDLFLVTQQLTLSPADGSDTDMYSCSAANLVDNSTRNFSIFVQVPPTVVALDGDRETVGIEEMMATIHFRIDDAAPPVNTTSIRWFFSSDLTSETPDGTGVIDITMESILANGSLLSYSTDRRSLTISNISQSDEGRYFFMATNPAGSRFMHTDLIVHGPPRIFQGPQDQTIIDTRSVTFLCEALADPVHSVVWSFNGSSIITTNDTEDTAKYSINRERSIQLRFGSLTVSNVQYSDRGVYQCTAVNYVGSVSASATLTVQVTPVIHQISSALTANITNTTSLYCVATGNPRPTISWLKNTIELTTSQIILSYTLNATDVIGQSDISLPDSMNVSVDASLSDLLSDDTVPLLRELGSVGLLVFTAVERGDTANYSCVATNVLTEELSDQSNSTQLTIQERPDRPRVVTIVSWTARSVYLRWEPSFDGNLPILGYNIYHSDLDRSIMDQPVVGATHPDYTTTQQEFNITSEIIPYTKYVFEIEACNLLGCGARNMSEPIRTETDAPDSPPRNCTVAAVSSTSLQATWFPPAEPNGLIDNYTVSYRPMQSLSGLNLSSTQPVMVDTVDNSTQLVLSQLLKGTSYSIMLTAYTNVGPGPSSTDQCTTYTLEDVPDGPPLNLSVYSDSSQSLIVSWAPPDLALQNGNITHHYITYTSARSGRQLTMNTPSLRVELNNLEIFTDYNITVASGTFVGTGPLTSTVVKTLNDTSGAPVDIITSNPSNGTIRVQWSPPPVPNGIITGYRVYYKPSKAYLVNDSSYNSSQQQTDVPVNSSEVTLPGLYLDATYTIFVTAFNGAGKGNRSNSILQFVRIPDGSKLIEVPTLGAPDTSEGGLRVTINLTPPSTLNGRISHYQVITVLLDQDTTIASIPEPDDAFPSLVSFSTYSTAADAINRTRGYAGYITAEFGRGLFPSDGRFTVGDPTEVANDRMGQYPNNPLQYGSRYTFFLRAYPLINTAAPALKQQVSPRQYTTFSSSEYTRPVFQTVGDPLPGIAGGVIAGLLVAVAITAIVLIVVVLYWRYTRTGKMEPDTSIVLSNQHPDFDMLSITSDIPLTRMVQSPIPDDEPLLAHPNIPAAKFEMHVQRLHANQNGLFAEEYKEIVENSPKPAMDVGLNPDNKCRNRYANIQCYDHSRVKLSITDEYDHDYINANFLPGFNRENEYIATQGPLPDTVGDFWRMVWDHDVYSIVMLTNLVEKMKVKCSQYWPDSCGLTKYANVSVSMVSTEQQADCVIRNFEIVADGHKETRTVRQFHFTSWPDFGVPRHALPVLQLVRQVRRYHKYTDVRPMVVHCSAGVGRTGTFVTIDVEMQRWQDKGVVNPCEFVTNLRKNRNHLVQTEGQYVFLHDAILEGITSGWTDFTAEQLPERMTELEEENAEGETGYHTEFNSLRKTAVDLSEFQAANMSANRFKNRLLNALPFDHNRVKMKKILGKDGSDYINASFIDGYKEKNFYIATQGPTRETVVDFWRMIWEQETAVIVMLTQVDERGQEMCSQYWPEEIDGEMAINGKTVITMSEQNFGDYVHRQLKVTEATRDSSVSRIVHQLQFLAWPELGAPKVGSAMIDLVGQVIRVQQQTGNKPIVVHCSAGIGRTGAFCALTIAIERVKAEGLVNVYQTVKHLRTQRPHMVQTLEQYIFCYRAVLEYVDSLSPYANFKGKKK